MKSICIFINSLLNGGAEKQAALLASALTRNFNVLVAVYYGEMIDNRQKKYLDSHNINIVLLTGSHFDRCVSFYKLLRQESIDIIFSYLLTNNLIACLLKPLSSVSYVVGGIRNSVIDKKKLLFQKILHNHMASITIYNNYRGLINLSKVGFKKSKAVVIPNCFKLNFPPTIRKDGRKISIVSVGRFVKQKDFHTSIESVANLRLKNTSFEYIIVGYGKLKNTIYHWIKQYNAEDYIKVVINPDDIETYYRKADIYLMTSIFEGLSNTVLEAMSHSLPLVVTDVGDNNKLVVDGKNGFLCQPGNYKQISEKLLKLVSSHGRRNAFGQKSYSILKKNYSFEIFQERYFDLIENLPKWKIKNK